MVSMDGSTMGILDRTNGLRLWEVLQKVRLFPIASGSGGSIHLAILFYLEMNSIHNHVGTGYWVSKGGNLISTDGNELW